MTTPAAEPRTETGRRLVVDGIDGVWLEPEAAQPLFGAILVIEQEARTGFARELVEKVRALDLDALNPEINRAEVLRLLDAEVPQEEQG